MSEVKVMAELYSPRPPCKLMGDGGVGRMCSLFLSASDGFCHSLDGGIDMLFCLHFHITFPSIVCLLFFCIICPSIFFLIRVLIIRFKARAGDSCSEWVYIHKFQWWGVDISIGGTLSGSFMTAQFREDQDLFFLYRLYTNLFIFFNVAPNPRFRGIC